MSLIRDNLARVLERIERVKKHEVTLVAVSKTNPASAVREAYEAGQRAFGENYVQELAEKAAAIDLPDLRWHFIGHLQRNKVKHVVEVGALIETVDSDRLAVEIDKRARVKTAILLQVNVGGEGQKSGCTIGELPALIERVRALPALELRGLMTIPPLEASPEANRPLFAKLRALRGEHGLRELSMGMSADLEVAIEEGATIVRVGTAIFGARV
jgi:pyridoxal phosphate enzyme (YggS family)